MAYAYKKCNVLYTFFQAALPEEFPEETDFNCCSIAQSGAINGVTANMLDMMAGKVLRG